VSIDPQSGAIQAYYGGDNGVRAGLRTVCSSSPVSTFKPFVLLADLLQADADGAGHAVQGASRCPGCATPTARPARSCDLKQAMTISNNVIFHELGRPGRARRRWPTRRKLAGINTPMNKVGRRPIALGDKEVTAGRGWPRRTPPIAAGGVYPPRRTWSPRSPPPTTGCSTRRLNPSEPAVSAAQVARNVIEAMLGGPRPTTS